MSRSSPQMINAFQRAGWLPLSEADLIKWVKGVVIEVSKRDAPLLPVVQNFQTLIETNSELYMGFNQMFEQQPPSSLIFNKIIQEAPFYGPIGPPFYMVLSAAMNTQGGFTTFLSNQLNAIPCVARIRSVLTNNPGGWFSSPALKAMTDNFDGLPFEQIFVSDPSAQYWGYKSWDDFFVRTLQPGIRTLQAAENPNVINAACESQLYNISKKVQERDTFWIKGEPYSLLDMLNQDEAAPQFMGGTVFQGFLSVTGYHRWHAPVTGVVRKVVKVPGTYFCQSPATLGETDNPYLRSLAFITSLATRMLIFIKSENERIGLMCFIAVGMTEVSTCEATVKEGDRVERGDELGMFHFGGSTHVLIFRPEANVKFFDGVDNPGSMVEVRAAIGGVA
ncbi:phosphatidylserine decarboxylase-domain-containing protein [Mycena rosella]|uniref:Phosphatidylserine decarboxylase-domain-containing protein n=1 Tax=Mycena rosella TaxID=1033263 RepID=A0AAD7CBI8_MYCRO|nr:phosphatidylserine decarboxylase-domain-containing protein [Mycena rosella]